MASNSDSPDGNELQRLQGDNERLSREVKRLVRTEVELFESHRQLDRQLRIYEHLHQVGKRFNATFDRTEILQMAVRFPVYELGLQRAVVLTRDAEQPNLFVVFTSEGYYGEEAQATLRNVHLDLEAQHPGLSDGEEIVVGLGEDGAGRQLAQTFGMAELAAYPVGGVPGRYDGLLIAGNQADKLHLYSRVEVGSGILIGLANFASHVSTAMKHAAAWQGLVAERQLLEEKVQQRTSELSRAHERLLRFEKESLEMQMAGGFAHEMRNAVGAIETLVSIGLDDVTSGGGSIPSQNAAYLEQLFLAVRAHLPKSTMAEAVGLVRSIIDNEEQLGRILVGVRSASQRALSITTSLLEYSRLGRSVRGADRVDLSRLVGQVLANSKDDLLRLGIESQCERPPQLYVTGTESHFYSIVSNLVNNARDALGEVAQGLPRQLKLTLRSDEERITILVTDSARGIPNEVLPRIFEPFFSTKPKTGTGLGLGVCKKLAELYAGAIEVESVVGRGTTFRVWFPARDLLV